MRMPFDFLAKRSTFSGQALMSVRSRGSGLRQPEGIEQSGDPLLFITPDAGSGDASKRHQADLRNHPCTASPSVSPFQGPSEEEIYRSSCALGAQVQIQTLSPDQTRIGDKRKPADAGCARSVREFRDSLDKFRKRNSQELLRNGELVLYGLLTPTQVPNNTEVVNPIKVRSFLEANAEVLTSNNAAELRAFLVESCSNWSDLVRVISDEACLSQGDLFGTSRRSLRCSREPKRCGSAMFAVWITTLFLLNAARGREVCYKRLGCFTDSPPWSGIPGRQLAGLPSSPEDVNTKFLLYTRDNIMKYQKISATNPSTIKASNFRTHRKTRFIIHGHLVGADLPWITNICRFMFHTEDVNCILTDWRGGSSGLYTEAVNNVHIVGAELVYLVNLLEKDYGYSPANIHFIGHSLGAHAAGEAGRRKPGIGRITGLDPAGPLFQYTPTTVRLDPSDAKFVDIIHTHAGHLFFDFAPGILQTCGHLDFYPNGGKKMPGCKQLRLPPATRNINDLMREYRSFGCGHKRSLRYYAESIITPNGFVGYQCETYRAFVLVCVLRLWNRAAKHVASPGTLLRLRGCPLWQPSASGRGHFSSQRQTINKAPSTDYEKFAQPTAKALFPN
nr:PREDICTED: pancreatic lipase-related protein 2-like [Haliaeetus albicilla]